MAMGLVGLMSARRIGVPCDRRSIVRQAMELKNVDCGLTSTHTANECRITSYLPQPNFEKRCRGWIVAEVEVSHGRDSASEAGTTR